VVALLAPTELHEFHTALTEFAMTLIVLPLGEHQLSLAMALACARATVERSLKTQYSQMVEQLQNRKLIERAKGMLMKRYRWSEHDAFRRLQRGAMNQRTSMANLAEAVVKGALVRL
jgi:response regulator NasT